MPTDFKDKYSFYLEKENKMFGGNVLVICYKADKEEIKKYGLTSDVIVLFVKSKKIDEIPENKDYIYLNNVNSLLDRDVIMRIQSECFLGMYGDSHCDCEEQRLNAIKIIGDQGGIFLHMPQEAQGWGLFYKLEELELQVSGRTPSGEFVGKKNRDDAQKLLNNTDSFEDTRSYEIIYKIFNQLNLLNKNFILITESNRKIQSMMDAGFKVEKYSDYKEKNINSENVSEYLAKIANSTHEYDDDIIDRIINVVSERKYNARTLSMLLDIVNKIQSNDDSFKLRQEQKDKFMKLYDSIICGEEKKYIKGDENRVKVQNNFSCRVDSSIFKVLTMIYGKGIFDRISLEKVHFFVEKSTNTQVRVRKSTLLDTVDEKCTMFVGQQHIEQSIYDNNIKRVIQNEVSSSTLRSYFENPGYDYIKRTEMVTIISENVLDDGINIYIKRLPKTENRIIDIFGSSENIKKLIEKIRQINPSTLFATVNDNKLSEQNFSNYNLRFADLNSIITEEMQMYSLTKGEDLNNGVRSKILLP